MWEQTWRDPAGHTSLRSLPGLNLLLLVALASGCGAGDAAGEWRGTSEMIDGVEVVRNPGTPLYDAGEVEVGLLWMVGGDAELAATSAGAGVAAGPGDPGPLVWAEPNAIRRSDTALYILDPMEARIHALDPVDGSWVRSIGRKGKGPGELDDPHGILLLDERVAVRNGGGTFEVFAEDGDHLLSVRTGGLTFAGYPLPGGRILANTMLGLEARWQIHHLDGRADSVPSWPHSVAIPGAEAEGGVLECQRTGTAGAFIIRSSCAVPHLQILDAEGRLLREFSVAREPDLVTDAEREAEVEKVRDELTRIPGMPPALIQIQLERVRNASRIRNSFRLVRVDPATGALALWKQNPELLGSGPATLHLFSDSGVYLAEIPFDRAWVDFDLRDSTLFVLERDPETDLVSASAYRVEVPTTAS